MLASANIGNLTVSENGLTACTFTDKDGLVFVTFKGTGKGEWIDNGEGLSGVAQSNTYKTYGKSGIPLYRKTVKGDYATDQQVEALNWFNSIAEKNGWKDGADINVCGHSKGGNKAQFIAVHSDLVNHCYSFDGQGFSPEALKSFKEKYGAKFEARRQKVYSFSADNDYVNVLGERLAPKNKIYYFESQRGIHFLEAILDINGVFNRQTEQGELSKYVESVSKRLMSMPPNIRKYATLGVTNVLSRFLGKGTPVNGDKVSLEQTVVGMGIAVDLLLDQIYER